MDYSTPVKCPECSTWWRGMEHRCGPASPMPSPVYPSTPNYPWSWPVTWISGTASTPPDAVTYTVNTYSSNTVADNVVRLPFPFEEDGPDAAGVPV